MPNNGTHSSSQTCTSYPSSMDNAIHEFLGLGLPYSAWPEEVKRRSYTWYPGLEKVIIQKEYEFFRDEIQNLRLEPTIVQSSRVKSNSLKSILKRLKGEVWMDGYPAEREERFQKRRLLSVDAKDRCFINYVQRWDREAAQLSLQTSNHGIASGAIPKDTEDRYSIPAASPPQASVSTSGISGIGSLSYQCAPGQESYPFRSPKHSNIDRDEKHAVLDYASQNPDFKLYSNPYFDPSCWPNEYSYLPAFQAAATFPEAQSSGPFGVSNQGRDITPPISMVSHEDEATMGSFDPIHFGDDDLPFCSGSHTPGIPLSEPMSNIFDFFDTDQMLEENMEIPDTESDSPIPLQREGSTNATMTDSVLVTAAKDNIESQIAYGPCFSHTLHQVSSGPSINLNSTQQTSRNARKRRRRNTFGRPPDVSKKLTISDVLAISKASPKDDIIITDHDPSLSFEYRNLNEQWIQLPPPLRPLPSPPLSILRFGTAQASKENRRSVEQAAIEARDELKSLTKKHQDALEYWSKKYQAMESEVHDLRKEVRRLQLLNERTSQGYDGMTHELISEKIIEEATSRKNSVSDVSIVTIGEEKGHSHKTLRKFPSSKNARPLSLSLSLRTVTTSNSTVTTSNSTVTAQNSRPTSLENAAILRLPIPIATGPSSRPGSADTLAFRPAPVHSRTSSSQCTSPISAALLPPGASLTNPTGRGTRFGSADSPTISNISTVAPRNPSPIKQLMRKISDGFMRKPHRDEKLSHVPRVPSLPTSSIPASALGEFCETYKESGKRLTNDSGYESLGFETSPRFSTNSA